MSRGARLVLRGLALGHFAWGALLLSGAVWFAVAALWTLPHLTTGGAGARLAAGLVLAATNGLPAAALGVWMILLGRRLWSARAGLRVALLWTHGPLFALGSLLVVIGIAAVAAAARSSAAGGGLLGPVAVLPLLVGAPVFLLALSSIIVALVVMPRRPGEGES